MVTTFVGYRVCGDGIFDLHLETMDNRASRPCFGSTYWPFCIKRYRPSMRRGVDIPHIGPVMDGPIDLEVNHQDDHERLALP